MARIPHIVAFAAVGALALTSCAATTGGQQNAAQSTRPTATRYTVEKGTIENKVVATGKITSRGAASLVFPRSGSVTTISVKEGDQVKAGQPLGALDTSDLILTAQAQYASYLSAQAAYSQTIKAPNDYDVQSARALLDSAKAAYNDLFRSPSDNEVGSLKAALNNADAALRSAQAAYDQQFRKNPAGIAASSQATALEQATNNYNAAKASLDKAYDRPANSQFASANAQVASAQAKLDALLAPVPAETLAQAKAKVDQAYIAWQQAENNVKNSTVTTPFDGVVTKVTYDPGDYASGGQVAFEVSDTTRPYFEIDVDEADIGNVRAGMPARVTLQAYSSFPISATVESVAPAAASSSNVVTFKVRLGLTLPERAQGAAGALPPNSAVITPTAGGGRPQGAGQGPGAGPGPGAGQGQRAGAVGAAPFIRPNFLLGMSGTAEVIIGGASDVIVVPNRALSVDRATRSSIVKRYKADGATEAVTVEVGLRGQTLTEIRSGLAVGDQLEIAAATTASGSQVQGGGGGNFVFGGFGGGGGAPGGGPGR